MQALLRRYGPRALFGLGVVRGMGVAAVAALLGLPLWLALVAAALWAGGSGAAAVWWAMRARSRQRAPSATPA